MLKSGGTVMFTFLEVRLDAHRYCLAAMASAFLPYMWVSRKIKASWQDSRVQKKGSQFPISWESAKWWAREGIAWHLYASYWSWFLAYALMHLVRPYFSHRKTRARFLQLRSPPHLLELILIYSMGSPGLRATYMNKRSVKFILAQILCTTGSSI